MKKLTLILIAALCFAGAASSAPPPRTAHYAGTQASALRHQLQVVRRQRHYLAIGCFHVAPRQWVCPLPAPKRSRSFHSNVGGGGGWPACSPSTNGWYFNSGYGWWRCGFSPFYGWIWVPV